MCFTINNDKKYTVYKHTNKINGKSYIGITSRKNINERFGKNGKGYLSQVFYKAISMYGWDNFSHDILYTGLSMYEAREKENELIKKYRNEYGVSSLYNISNGGETSYLNGLIICIETGDIFKSTNDVINKYEYLFHGKIESNDIYNCCRNTLEKIKIPWRDKYLHFQFYTNNYNSTIKEVEENYNKHIQAKIDNRNKIEFKFNENLHKIIISNTELTKDIKNKCVCNCCGRVITVGHHKNKFGTKIYNKVKYCNICKKNNLKVNKHRKNKILKWNNLICE